MVKGYLLVGKAFGLIGVVSVVKHFESPGEAIEYLEQAHKSGTRWVEDPVVYPVGEPLKVTVKVLLTP